MTFEAAQFGHKKPGWIPLALALVYFIFLYFVIGWSFLNFFLIAIVLCGYYFHEGANRFVIAILPLLIYWILYDAMRGFPNDHFQKVNIQEIYELEKEWFGIVLEQSRITPNEYFAQNTNRFLDFLGGLIYVNWFTTPIFLAVYSFFKNKRKMLEFLIAFLILNIMGLITYYSIPVAPPWYVELHGFEFKNNIQSYEAGLQNFDQMFDITLFRNMYRQLNSQVFAALPSLHSAFPVLVFMYGLKIFRYSNIIFLLHAMGIWFFAVYLRHHYILDVLLGISYALFSYWMMSRLTRIRKVDELLNSYEKRVSNIK